MLNRTPEQDQVVIGLDVGTTSVKCLALPVRPGRRAGVLASRPTGTTSPRPGWQVQDPAQLLHACDEALTECVARSRGTVVAVGVSTAMHGLVGLDADGSPLTDLLTWGDTRASAHAAQLHRDGRAATFHQVSGTPVHAMSPLVKLAWWRDNDPELHEHVATWTDLKGLVLRHLTGRDVIDRSSAGGTGLLDRHQDTWNPTALAVAGVGRSQLPDIVEPEAALRLTSTAAARTGLPPTSKVVAGASDGPSGNLGTGAVAPGVAGLSLGTSGALRVVVRGRPTDLPSGLFCYLLARDRWVIGGAISNGGNALSWLTRTLLSGAPETDLLNLAGELPPGADGLSVVPYLTGERAPLWDPALPGMILGLRAHHGPAHLVRATFEGVALQLAAVLAQVIQVAPVEHVVLTGGALRHGWQLQCLAAALERPVVLGRGTDGSALGAAAYALHSSGHAPGLDAAAALLREGAEPPSADTSGQTQHPVTAPDPGAVRTYRQSRRQLHTAAAQLGRVATSLGVAPGPMATQGNSC
ncbi:gluconokinase [uncultured Serinicoccus sp.]|uniref:gluconokinase n=1 Tax=uncultured Serinicoccus sp. TaxID=735514 RepID=UPI002609822C|nr:gluconokinase [uncultured Serinicoccus sp.]